MKEILKRWVINDYFTPNIKAEVILDTMLSPYIGAVLSDNKDCPIIFVTKEMSINTSLINNKTTESDNKQNDSEKDKENIIRGPKIDYVFAGKKSVYLVELKTATGSINDKQLEIYKNLAEKELFFGVLLGNRLLEILKESFNIKISKSRNYSDNSFKEAWFEIWNKKNAYVPKGNFNEKLSNYDTYADAAKDLIKAKGWTAKMNVSSRKYLYTLGQILDYLLGDKSKPKEELDHIKIDNNLWNRQLKFIYLLPSLDNIEHIDFGQIEITEFCSYFKNKRNLNTFGNLLADIITDIYL